MGFSVWSEFKGKVFGFDSLVFVDREGQTSWAWPSLSPCYFEVFNVGGWLTHGDLALDAGLDSLAVAEHRLIPDRVRSEWSRLRGKGLSSIWAPVCQDSSHVCNAGMGVVGLRGAPLSLPTFASVQFKKFFDCGRAVRCMLPLGSGRFVHPLVLYGYQGADADPEQLASTDQLFDAALAELSVVARGQPCMLGCW